MTAKAASARPQGIAGLGLAAGAVLAIAGLADLLLALLPGEFGNPNWEIVAFSQLTAGMAVPQVGLLLVAVSGAALGRRAWVVSAAAGACLVAGVALTGLVLVGLDGPLVWNAAQAQAGGTAAKTLTMKAIGLSAGHLVTSVILALGCARALPKVPSRIDT
jgi:hypothetical protein